MKRAVAASVVAFFIGAGMFSLPANATSSTAMDWVPIGTYPGTPAGLKRCHSDGKSLALRYECRYYPDDWEGEPQYALYILT